MGDIGRPRKEIDFDQLEKLCSIQCTQREIAAYFKCSEDSVERRIREKYDISFAEYYEQHSTVGKVSIRRKLFEKALTGKGDFLSLKWLSQNHLLMSEKVETKHEVTGKDDEPLTFRVRFDDEEPSAPSGSDPAAQDPTPKTDL